MSAWAYYQVLLSDPFFESAVRPAVTDLEAVRLGLARVGLTLQTYAAILHAGQVIITAVCCILSALIFWRRKPAPAIPPGCAGRGERLLLVKKSVTPDW